MRSGIIYICTETYQSSKSFIGFSDNSDTRNIFDTVKMQMPSIVSMHSVDVERDFQAITAKLRKHGMLDEENNIKNIDLSLDIFMGYFKDKLSDAVAQEIDADTLKMMNDILCSL